MGPASPCSRPTITELDQVGGDVHGIIMYSRDLRSRATGLEDPVTRAGGLAVQLIPADQNEGRIYECCLEHKEAVELKLYIWFKCFYAGTGTQAMSPFHSGVRSSLLNTTTSFCRRKP